MLQMSKDIPLVPITSDKERPVDNKRK
jgi:hypothetical protein